MTLTDPRRERIHAVIRDFFKNKPPGTTIEQHELDAYHRRLRKAAQDRIAIGTSVRVVHQPDRDRGYVEESRGMRRIGNGLTGVTVAEHDGHGLCYEVKFAMSGTVITYDREELEIVPSPTVEERSP